VIAAQAFTTPSYTITTSETWEDESRSVRDIVIEQGGQLTIKDSKIRFTADAKIIVKRGARLIVDRSRLTANTCAGSDWWQGIRVWGNRNKVQPDPKPNMATHTLAPDDAGVVVIKNFSIIEHARNAISTNDPLNTPSPSSNYWGGVIYASDTEFSNNWRCIEVMSYPGFTQKSQFKRCVFEGNPNNAYTPNNVPALVSIWNSEGIQFEACTFKEHPGTGLIVYDGDSNVKTENEFEANQIGIASLATFPSVSRLRVGEDGNTPNTFKNNGIDIRSHANDGIDGLQIINNEFYDSDTCMVIVGPSRFDIEDNYIVPKTPFTLGSALYVLETGVLTTYKPNNLIRRNYVKAPIAMTVRGPNERLQFKCNDFRSQTYDFFFLSSSAGTAAINDRQGNEIDAADNCFNGMGVPSIVTLGTTTSFEYYRTQEFLCYTPDTSLLSGPFSSTQYDLKNAFRNKCDQNRAAPSPPYTLEDYLSVTDSLDMGGNINSVEWEKLQERKDWIIIELLRDYLTQRDLGSAFYLLDLENTTAAKMKKFGIQMHYGLYQEARLTLQAFSHTIPEMVHFKRIQSINIDRLEVGMDYELLTEDKTYLDSIARTE